VKAIELEAIAREAMQIAKRAIKQYELQNETQDAMLRAIEAAVATGDMEQIRSTVGAVRAEHDKVHRRETVGKLLADLGWES